MNSAGVVLRDYQERMVERCYAVWDERPAARVMLQLPTGGGKTEIAAAIAMRHYDAGGKAMFVCHRKGLVGQTVMRFAGYGLPAVAGSDTGGIAGPSTWAPGAPQPSGLVVVGVETYRRRQEDGLVATDGLLIIDEAHTTAGNASRQALFRGHKGPLLALTATPWRLSDKEGFTGLCDVLILGPPVAELIEGGWLAPYRARSLADLNLPTRDSREIGRALCGAGLGRRR